MSSLVYVYAIAPSQPERAVRGIGGQSVRWITESELLAAASDVPNEEFNEEALNAGLSDMQWLAPLALAHQEVNQQLHEASDALVPLAFGTVFRDDARVAEMLRQNAVSLQARLARVRGCSEWVVTVHATATPDTSQAAAVQQMQQEIAAVGPGRAHLMRKRLAEVEKEAARQAEHDAVERVLGDLRRLAQDVFVESLPNDVVERPLLRASVLMRRSDEDRFVRLVEGLQSHWLSVALTGPWPPYRFGGLNKEHAAASR